MKQELPLRDIHLPEAVSAWPPAIGWWLLAALLIAGIATLAWHIKRKPATPAAPRIDWPALFRAELADIKQAYTEQPNQQRLAMQLHELLRKIVIKQYPELASQVSGQTGRDWLNTLRQYISPELEQYAAAITEAPYNPKVDFDADGLLEVISRALNERSQIAEASHAGV